MLNQEVASFSIANPDRIKSRTVQELRDILGSAVLQTSNATNLTEAEIEELTTRVD